LREIGRLIFLMSGFESRNLLEGRVAWSNFPAPLRAERSLGTCAKEIIALKKGLGERDCEVILNVVRQMPKNTLQEEPKLSMRYEQALVRTEGD
jgi:hypothetical protein